VVKLSDLRWKRGDLNIKIDMYTRSPGAHHGSQQEHGPGHVHVTDSKGQESQIKISTGEITDGSIDSFDLIQTKKWIKKNRRKLQKRFKKCMTGERPDPIDGLVES
jgi:hypothetical protein